MGLAITETTLELPPIFVIVARHLIYYKDDYGLNLDNGRKSYQRPKRRLKLIEKDYRSSFDLYSTKENHLVTTVPIIKMKNAPGRVILTVLQE